MYFEIQPIVDMLVTGASFSSVCTYFQGQNNWPGNDEAIKLLKGQYFTKRLLKKLMNHVDDPFEIIQKLTEITQLFTLKSPTIIKDFVQNFINRYEMRQEYLKYLDILVKCPIQANSILQRFNPPPQIQLNSYGEISWLLMQNFKDGNKILQWIDQAHQRNHKRGINKAKECIINLYRQLELEKKKFNHAQQQIGVKILGEHIKEVTSVCLSKSEKFVVSGSYDCTVRLWDMLDESRNMIIGQHQGIVESVDISKSEKIVVSGGYDKTVRFWDLENPSHNKIIGWHQSNIWSVCISKSERIVISGSFDNTIRLWDLQDSYKNMIVGELQNSVFSVCISQTGRFIVSGGHDNSVQLWDLQDSSNNNILGYHQHWVKAVCISKNERIVVSGSHDKTIKLWNLLDPSKNIEVGQHQGFVLSLCISKRFIISGSRDKTIRIWNLKNPSLNAIIGERQGQVWSVCISRNERKIISGSWDKKVRVWEIQ